MSKATESAMNKLHGAVAKVLTSKVEHQSATMDFDEDGNPIEGDMDYDVTPQMMAAAIKFLKDNDITANIEQDENLNGLEEALKRKQKHSRLRDAKSKARLQAVGE